MEGVKEPDTKMAWIIVDRDGERFMNEYPPYFMDTGHRAGVEQIDLRRGELRRIPCYMLVDDLGRQLYRLGEPYQNDPTVRRVQWQGADANLDQVRQGLLKQFDTIDQVANFIGCDATRLNQTLNTWNKACTRGEDAEFGRPPASIVPVRTPPFIVGELWPLVSNTQGGPAHDERQRVLNSFGHAIPRLYVAGECGAIWGFLYLGAGNYSECIVGGRIAGKELAKLAPLE